MFPPGGVLTQEVNSVLSLLDGLVSWWAMEETGAATRVDSAGGHNATAYSTPGTRTGIKGNACDFNGSTQYLQAAHHTDLRAGARDFSFALWVELDTLAVQTFVCKANTGTPSSTTWEWQIGLDDSPNQFRFILGVGSAWPECMASTFGTPSIGTKYCIYAEYKHSTTTMGISINNGTLNTLSSGGTPNTTTQPVTFGVFPGIGQWANGGLDEFAFWSRLLTTAERTEYYNSGSGVTYTEL